jgi:hypothetical protein
VKQITSDAFSLRHGHQERIEYFRIGSGRVCRFRQVQAMGQRLQAWRSGDGERTWLSMLVDTMEYVARPEFRALPCEPSILAALRAQLERPASPYRYFASDFSLRN